MLAPREWRVETTEEFEADRARVEEDAPRFDDHLRLWMLWLERRPFEYSEGLTAPDEELRVVRSIERITAEEYIVGIEVDRRRHVVTLRWLHTLPFLDG